jgi:hypothetical protein
MKRASIGAMSWAGDFVTDLPRSAAAAKRNARRRQFGVTRSALAGGMNHEHVDRALVFLAASVQMLGPST